MGKYIWAAILMVLGPVCVALSINSGNYALAAGAALACILYSLFIIMVNQEEQNVRSRN